MSKKENLDSFLEELVKTGPAGCGLAVAKGDEIL